MIGNTNVPLGSVSGSGGTPEYGDVANGIYLVNADGVCYNPDDTSVSGEVGVAIVTDDCCFIVSGNRIGGVPWMSGSYTGWNTDISSVPTTTSSSAVYNDLDGVSYTDAIVARANEIGITDKNYCAALWARNADSIGIGTPYLGSAGEWKALFDNFSVVKPLLELFGIEFGNEDYYWVSAESNESRAWFAYVLGGEETGYTANSKSLNETYNYTLPFYKVEKSDLRVIKDSGSDDGGTTNPSNGVYIQSVDGKLYTESEWDGTKTPSGIAVVIDYCSFVMALQDTSSSGLRWGGHGHVSVSEVDAANSTAALMNFNGEYNTTAIINALKGVNDGYADGAPAAECCRAYTFPNGAVGYMGAAGEFAAALDNKAAVVSALSKVGGTAMSGNYWTSVQDGLRNAWMIDWDNATISNPDRRESLHVRAFASL